MIVDGSWFRHVQDRCLGDGGDSRLRRRLCCGRARGMFQVLVRDRLRTSMRLGLGARLGRNGHGRVLVLLCLLLLLLLILLSVLLIRLLLRCWGSGREGVRHGAHIKGCGSRRRLGDWGGLSFRLWRVRLLGVLLRLLPGLFLALLLGLLPSLLLGLLLWLLPDLFLALLLLLRLLPGLVALVLLLRLLHDLLLNLLLRLLPGLVALGLLLRLVPGLLLNLGLRLSRSLFLGLLLRLLHALFLGLLLRLLPDLLLGLLLGLLPALLLALLLRLLRSLLLVLLLSQILGMTLVKLSRQCCCGLCGVDMASQVGVIRLCGNRYCRCLAGQISCRLDLSRVLGLCCRLLLCGIAHTVLLIVPGDGRRWVCLLWDLRRDGLGLLSIALLRLLGHRVVSAVGSGLCVGGSRCLGVRSEPCRC